jgi:hypothetical protein
MRLMESTQQPFAAVEGATDVSNPLPRLCKESDGNAGSSFSKEMADLSGKDFALERYKSHIKVLTQFGDRMQGTQRNRYCPKP